MVNRTTFKWINKHTKFIGSQFLKAVEDGCAEWLGEMLPDLQAATSTWKHKPTFIIRKKDGQIVTRSKRFKWVNDGTRVRYAKLSKNWVSKSTPGSLVAGSGAGKVLKRVDGTHRGIKPRHFEEPSAIKQAPKLPGIIAKHINARAAKIWK